MGYDDLSRVKRVSICCAACSSTVRCCDRSLNDFIGLVLESSSLRSDDTERVRDMDRRNLPLCPQRGDERI